ncbi:hypothetical protein [Sphingobium sp. EM0848]|uniref:hypothetical protein n=1 Tax=Sphingobium sp. EM0848 TaxID=2743473 RepID=UPI00159C206A|nr:hypothetical protein [Sphingobium sp. EM0848]
MLIVETIAKIRREHRDGKPIKEIARDLRLSRNSRQPPSLTPRSLIKLAAIPLDWKRQREALGF